jgi:hypothetical protein
MATQLQIRRGTSTQVAAFTGAEGEIVVNTTNDSIHVNDGSTAGGFEMARADLNNVSDTDLNAALTGNTVSALTVTALTSSGIDVTGTVTADGLTVDGDSNLNGVANVGGSTDLLYLSGKTGTHAYVSLGSSNTAADFFIGADTAIPLIFRTDATERMAITSAGDTEFSGRIKNTRGNHQAQLYGTGDNVVLRHDSNSSGLLALSRAGSLDVVLDASGNLMVGKTASSAATAGHEFKADGAAWHTADSTFPLFLNRETDDGELIRFRKDNSNVGMISTVAGRLGIGTGDAGLFFDDDNNRIGPVTLASGTPVDSDGVLDLGYASARYKDLYLSGGAYLGGTAAANKLDYYEETAWTPTQSGVTLSVSVARAIRIGNLVTLACRLTFPSNSDSTLVGISGLPFTRDTNWQSAGAVMSSFVDLPPNYTQLNYFLGGSTINLYAGGDDVGWSPLTNSDMSGGHVIFNVTYQTNA